MHESPRIRRLRSDRAALEKLQSESSIFQFTASGNPADFYQLRFQGRGIWKPHPQSDIQVHDRHEVHIRLGASYPRMMPELAWKSPIFHPNISASGVVCLGGYGTYWVPSLTLDELCTMLWDMIRYDNYDEKSPYNREAAAWIKAQDQVRIPLDDRPLRDRLAGYIPKPAMRSPAVPVAVAASAVRPPAAASSHSHRADPPAPPFRSPQPVVTARPIPDDNGVVFLDTPVRAEVVAAEVVDAGGSDGGIMFIN